MSAKSSMKAILLSAILVLLFNHFSIAQATWNLSGSDAYYNSGFVGVGTSSPSRRFVISNGGALGLEIDPSAAGGTITELLNYDRSLAAYKPLNFYASTFGFLGGPSYYENLRISGNVIEEYQNDVDGGSGSVNINYRGYNGGTTRFRNFVVFDGKNNPIIEVTGSTKETNFSGIVGIGVTNSLYALNVERASSIIRVASISGTNGTRIQLENNAGTAYVGLDNSTGGLGGAYSLNVWHGGAYPIVFATNNTEKARILSDGKFLVGVSSPFNNDLMHVNGRAHFAGRITAAHETTGDNNAAFSNTSNSGYGLYSRGGGGSQYAFSVNTYNEQNLFIITGAGNVGVGTTTPTSKLEISTIDGAAAIKAIGNDPSNAKVEINNTNGINFALISGITSVSNTGFSIRDITNNANRLVILNNGNVGIGTTNPDQALTVNGKIHAKELKIDLSIPPPDYVFEKNYDLKSLEEVEKYIKANKHLPEVPSAKEMQENGINTGEMNMLLLKKVEELTLYVIELKSEVEKLKSEKDKK